MDYRQLVVTGFIGSILPVIVGLVTRWTARSEVKAVVLLFLSGLSGLLTEWIANPHLNLWAAIIYAGLAWVTAVATHFGLWKPGNVTVVRSAPPPSGTL